MFLYRTLQNNSHASNQPSLDTHLGPAASTEIQEEIKLKFLLYISDRFIMAFG